ncbi:glycerophosphodiester phosphodiesterase family protein [Paenibacillus nasutitermitis]|uniref:Glycerophosphoryl diester phosphodiesterase n=1 Tax=Paenibacillus nasutitermitis TaxID=1652958 RepID=A0A917DQG0_9BACL|nr:glycerophosphodiester phosphodiesterase family protein [Paenibacillus nasutitermitis]GGD56808.1 glycerophosphoryl diester phosphodiesterase [Paenibacillus nasutitermitis]
MRIHSTNPLFNIRNSVHHPRFIAHRGFTVDGPENSFPAFTAAGAKRFWAIETDVHITLDGVLVCNHDSTIDKMYDGTGKISEMTWEDIQKYAINVGNHVETFPLDQRKMPTFEQYLRICRYYGSVPFIELKTTGIVNAVLEMVREYNMEDYSVISTTKLPMLKEVREITERLYIHHILSNMETAPELSELGNAGIQLDYADVSLVPESDVKHLHNLGLNVCIRSQDTEEGVKNAIKIGMDYIPTNTIYRLTV